MSTNPPDRHQELLLLGQIHGIVQGLKEGQQALASRMEQSDASLSSRLDKVDERLRTVEQRSAAVGAVSGGVMSVGMAIVIEGLKTWLRRGGHDGG